MNNDDRSVDREGTRFYYVSLWEAADITREELTDDILDAIEENKRLLTVGSIDGNRIRLKALKTEIVRLLSGFVDPELVESDRLDPDVPKLGIDRDLLEWLEDCIDTASEVAHEEEKRYGRHKEKYRILLRSFLAARKQWEAWKQSALDKYKEAT